MLKYLLGDKMKSYVKGNYRSSIFKSEKGYVIGLFKVRETNDEEMKEHLNKTITFTGYFHDLNVDDTYVMYGKSVIHAKYGHQYEVSSYERLKPTDKDGVISFLSSDLFKGVGETMATKIVDHLGDDALKKILDDEHSLLGVSGLSSKKASLIRNNLKKYEDSQEIIIYLTELGFSNKDALDIYNNYKDNSKNKVLENIYEFLSLDLDASFSKIDNIALNLGYSRDNENRIKSYIIYSFKEVVYKNGDVYLTKEELRELTSKSINIDYDVFEDYLSKLVLNKDLILLDGCYYLKDMFDAETNIINKLYKLNDGHESYKDLDKLLKKQEKSFEIEYNKKQKEAIKKAIENNMLIITGGPGTGKTTIIKSIIDMYKTVNDIDYDKYIEDVVLLAPTGRAANKMSEKTDISAMTIHRFLKWNKESGSFSLNEYNKSVAKLVIVDEFSMVDINLFDSLLKALLDDVSIILVGDHHQLPSVGPGRLLKDLIDSDVVDTVFLDELYRQSEDSFIPVLATNIKNNINDGVLSTHDDYTFLECDSEMILESIKETCIKISNKNFDLSQVQVVAPMYRGIIGIDNLNKMLQEVFNPKSDKDEYAFNDQVFREDDKVLQLVNMPENNVYNGDIGFIKRIVRPPLSKSGRVEVKIDFNGNLVTYRSNDMMKIKHGYAISIHKTQGSEFDICIIPQSMSYKRMLYKKLLYTAVTRAKKKLILVGDVNAYYYSLNNEFEYDRNSILKERFLRRYEDEK